MNTSGLGGRIDDFEDSFRELAEAGLFSREQQQDLVGPSTRTTPRVARSVLELSILWILGWLSKPGHPPRRAPASASAPISRRTTGTASLQIAETIRRARELVEQKHLPQAAAELSRGELLLHQAIYRRSRLWRSIRIHQIPLFLYYFACLAVLAAVALSPARRHMPSLWGVPPFVLGLGVLGAVLRGLYWLQLQVSRQRFRTPFILAHLAAPWLGLVLGLGSYLLVKGGLLTIEATSGKPATKGAEDDSLVRLA